MATNVSIVSTEWQEKPEDEELSIWEDNWDDDDIEDDFCQQLKWVTINLDV